MWMKKTCSLKVAEIVSQVIFRKPLPTQHFSLRLVMCWLGLAWKPWLKLSLEWLRACQNWSLSHSQGLGLRPQLVWGKVGCIKSRHTRKKSNDPAAPHHHPHHQQQAHPLRIVPLAQMPHWNQYQHLQYPHHWALSQSLNNEEPPEKWGHGDKDTWGIATPQQHHPSVCCIACWWWFLQKKRHICLKPRRP